MFTMDGTITQCKFKGKKIRYHLFKNLNIDGVDKNLKNSSVAFKQILLNDQEK